MPEFPVGTRVRLSVAGKSAHHGRLHGICGTIRAVTDSAFEKGQKIQAAAVSWDEIVLNSGSSESMEVGGPFMPRRRAATSLIACKFLEAA